MSNGGHRHGVSRLHKALTALVLLLAVSWAAMGQQGTREAEIAQCRPDELQTWGDGVDRPAAMNPMVFVYSHANAPPWFSADTVLTMLRLAAREWSRCGVPSAVYTQDQAQALGLPGIAVGWSDADNRGTFGLAYFSQRKLVLGPAAFVLLRERNPAHDARSTLQMVISHEMGHLYGLMAHSRRCVDVTSLYENARGERCSSRQPMQPPSGSDYRAALPTACDLQRCRSINQSPLLANP